MLKVIIYKDKISATKIENSDFVEYTIADGSIIKYLNRIVEIKPDVTVEDFMRLLSKHEIAIDSFFDDYTKGIPYKLFMEDMEKETVDGDLEEVELCWEGEVLNNDLAIIGYLRAWLKEEKVIERGEEIHYPHDVSFLPIYIWKKCRLVLNEAINIVDVGDGKRTVTDEDIVFAGLYRWTLFEVLSNFLLEISMNGSPQERDELFSKMEDRGYDLKEVVKNKEQVDFWITVLESELEDMKSALEQASDEEDYEKAAIIQKEMEIIGKELNALREEAKKHLR